MDDIFLNSKSKMSEYKGILHNPNHSDNILKMTADTMFMLSRDGICIDIQAHTDRWFLQDTSILIGKNIFSIIPSETSIALKNNFSKVLSTGISSFDNYEMRISGKSYFFKCIIHKYNEDLILCQYRDITQRILMKQKIESMNQRLQDIEKVAQIGQWIYNFSLDEVQYTGYSGGLIFNEEYRFIQMQDYLKFVHPEDRTALWNFIHDKVNANNNKYFDFRFLTKNNIKFFRLKTINCYYEDGVRKVSGYVQNISDIMEKKHELEMVTLAVENSTDYIFAMNTDGQLAFGNSKFKEYNGLKLHENITNFNFFEINKRNTEKTRWLDIIGQLTSTNQNINFVLPKPIPDRPDIFAFDCTSYLVRNSKGINLIWTFGKDITERVQYEKQVKELNQIMSTVLKNIPMYISVKDVDNDLKYIFSNRFDNDNFHWGIDDGMIGKTDFDIFPKNIAERLRAEDIETIKSNHESRKIIEDKDQSGNKQVRDLLRILVKDETRPLLISIERDITKDKQLEQELISAKENAEQSDKLKSAFIANMSHEIRTPLNAIVGFSRIIAETDNIEERQSYYSIVESNNARLLGLINEILDLSKIESGIMEFDFEPISLHRFCNEIVQTLSLRCAKEVELIFDKSDPNLVINTDKNRLSQVFSNLIGNASKFTQQGSIRFGYIVKPDHLEFYVKDTGSGIMADKLDKVFERFVKADNFTQGTGLGLPICKSIIEKLGGRISVSSKVGSGTCFTFTLPLNCLAESVTELKPETAQIGINMKSSTILVAEDTDSNYKLLDAMIGKSYKLMRAKNGMEAVTMFENLHPELILMDIKMPVMNGLDATVIIRKMSSVPIIAQSAFAFDEDRINALKCGCNDFLAKPFNKKQVVEMINKYLK
ncbi:MAG: ATP-binding protein [Bacteroidales bacterium]|nr:ATP-binding protein [Bacteroidales bacterium]